MASGFDIGIVSSLQIDPKSSAADINKVISSSSFTSQLNKVAVSLEASVTQKDVAALRKSVREITDNAFNGQKQPSVKVGLQVNHGEAVRSINSALTKAAKDLKKIKVDIDARVDKNTLKEQLTRATNSASNNKSVSNTSSAPIREASAAQDNLNRKKREEVQISAQTKQLLAEISGQATNHERQVTALQHSYKNVNTFINEMTRLSQESGKHVDFTTKKITDLENGHKRATFELRQYNDELKKVQTTTINARLDERGAVVPKSISTTDNKAKVQAEETKKAVEMLNSEIRKNEILIGKSSPIENTLKQQNLAYKELAHSQTLTLAKAKELVQANKLATVSAKQQADATALQTKLLSDYRKAMQQNARHIDKGSMQGLLSEIKQVDVTSTNALASLRGYQSQMRGYVNDAAQATRSQMGIMENFQNAMLKFPIWMGASTLFFGAIASGKQFISTIIDIDSKMVTLQKVMGDSANMDETWNDATTAAERYGQTISDVLDAYAEFARQGYQGADLANLGNAAMVASNVGEISAQDASGFLTAANAQWQTDTAEAMKQVDSWNNISNKFATTVEKLGEGQAKAGSSARAMGLDFDETNAVIGALTAQTKQSGSEIGNFIKAVFPRAYTVSKNVFDDLGISLQNANGETKNAIELYREAAHAMEGMSTADQADVVRGLGGTHHYQRMQVLLDTLRETDGLYDQILESSQNADGSAAQENAVYMQSLEAQINKSKVAIEQFSLALGEAFLESGIITFLTEFTNFLTLMTKAFTDLSPAVRNAGFAALVVTLSMASKNARNFYSALSNFPQLLSDINARAKATRANFNSLMDSRATKVQSVYATPEMGNAVSSMQKQQQSMMVATSAHKQLSNAQKGTAATSRTLATTTSTLSGVTTVATGATNLLRGALTGLMAATGVGLVISGITWALGAFINKSAEATQATNEWAQSNDILKQSMEQDSENVRKVAEDYMKLEEVINSGDYSESQLEKYKSVSSEMASLFPDLVSGSEDFGTSLANQQSLIETRIQLTERQIQAEKELAIEQQKNASREIIETGVEAEGDANKLVGKTTRDLTRYTAGRNNVSADETAQRQKEIDNIKTINDLMEYRNTIQQRLNELEQNKPANYEQEKIYLNDMLGAIETRSDALFTLNQQIIAGLNETGQAFMTNTQEILAQSTQLEGESLSLVGAIANQVSSLNLGAEETKNIFSNLESTLIAETGFQEKMASYESAVQGFKNASSVEEYKTSLAELETAWQGLAESISQSLSTAGMPEEQIESVLNSMKAQIDEQYNLNGAFAESNGVITDTIAHQNMLAEEMESTTDGLTAQQEAVKGLTDSFRELDGQMGTIESAMEQLADTGFIDTDTMYELLELYPELLGQQMTQAEMNDFLAQKHNDLQNTKMQNYIDEMMTSEAVMQNIIADEDHKLNETAARYGIDLQNYNTVAAAKADVSRLFNEGTVEQQNAIIDALGERYGIDLSNFGDLASKKAAIEAELMQMITDAWNAHIEQLQALAPELNSFLKDFEGAEGLKTVQDYKDNLSPKDMLINNGLNKFTETGRQANTLLGALEKVQPMYNDLISAEFGESISLQAGAAADGLFKTADASDIVSGSLNGLGNNADVVGSSLAGAGKKAKGAGDKASKAGKKAEKAAKEAKEKVKDLDVEVETLTKTFQKQTFVLNEFEERLRKITNQIEKQNLQTQRYATHSANYRKALQKENKLNREKLEAMKAQEKSLGKQIKSGKLKQYGMVNSDLNVQYHQYNAQSSGSSGSSSGGGTVRQTGRVTQAGGKGKVSPFAGWKVNYGYSPQGGGNYGARIGFNGGRHYGIDFGGRTGQAIKTPHGGQVIRAGWSKYGGGNQVEIYNKALDKTFTFMHMLSGLNVRAGQTVQAGQQVGRMGSTGNSTGTHLHFQVNTGRGLNNSRSVNPNAYLASGGSSFVGAVTKGVAKTSNLGTATPSKIGKSISEETASYLNDVEQARLDSIEKAVNDYNAKEQNKSDLHDAKVKLDEMELERLKLMAEIREIEYKMVESQIESYEVSKNKLNHKISELEYKAESSARLAGKTTDSAEWRKWMNKAHTEREKQLRFQKNQVKYIESVLRADSKKNPANRMNEAYRFQLEEQMRSAKEEMISLQRAVDESMANMLGSRVNQLFNEIDKVLEEMDNKITLIAHKRHFLDTTYQGEAGKYRHTLNEEIKVLQAREARYEKQIRALKNLRGNLKQQPELYEQVNDKIKESEEGIRSVQTAIYDLRKEGQQLEIDKMFERLNKRLETSQKQFTKLQDRAAYINQEMQKDLYFDNQADILIEMADYQKVIKDNIKQLKSMLKVVKQFPSIHKSVTEEIKNWEEQLKTTNQEMHTMRAEFASSFVESVKSIYQVQRDEAIKAIDEETSEFEKMINKKIELIDKQNREENYNDEINERQEQLQKLRNEIAQRMGDDSLSNQKALKDLQEELSKAEKDYNKFITDKQREDRKEALQEELSDFQEQAEDRKESSNKAYDDLLNDQRTFNKMQEEIMAGQIGKYKGLYTELTEFIGSNMKEIGRSISEGLLDGITTPFEALQELTGLLATLDSKEIPVLSSGLKPTVPSVDTPLMELMKGVSNTASLAQIGLPQGFNTKPKEVAQTTTNNNSNNFNSLLNIENFRGTKGEQDKLLNSLVVELRKLGVTV